MEDPHSVESARKDLDVIFKKINDSLREIQSGAPEKNAGKITKSEVSFQIEEQEQEQVENQKPTRSLAKVSHTPEFTSLPLCRYSI